MDPALLELMEEGAADDDVSVIARLTEETQAPAPMRVISRFGTIVTGRVRRGDIRRTWESPLVVSLKAARAVVAPLPFEDVAHAVVEDLFDPPAARPEGLREDGRGVVLAVCDWGLDFTHPNFRNADGTTRLIGFWDQRGRGGTTPQPFGYGRVHTRAEIDAALRTSNPFGALGYDLHRSDPGGRGSHGTHVTDIAAGNRRAPGSTAGIASGADLLFVEPASLTMGTLADFGDSVCLLEALDFVRQTVAGRPCVINLSAGKTGGEHRGTSPFEMAVDAMVLGQNNLALVQSAGNYGSSLMHSHGRVGPARSQSLHWIVNRGDRTSNELEVWYSGSDVFEVSLVSPHGERFTAPLGDRVRLEGGAAHWGNLYHRHREPNSGLNHIDIFLRPSAPAGTWRVEIVGREVVDGRFHAWIERDASGRHQSRFAPEHATPEYTTNTICNSMRGIAVGAHDAARSDRPPTSFSSRGPTADERLKPEISAPGFQIRAARSMPPGGWRSGESMLTVKSGTSMASPHVAGTVALMYQAAPRPLSIHDLRRALIGSADPPAPGVEPARLGYGYLNIEAAVRAVRELGPAPRPAPPPRGSHHDAFESHEAVSRAPSDERPLAFSPRHLFDAVVRGRGPLAGQALGLEIVAQPGEAPRSSLRSGDLVIRRALGEGMTSATRIGEQLAPEQALDPSGRVGIDTLILRAAGHASHADEHEVLEYGDEAHEASHECGCGRGDARSDEALESELPECNRSHGEQTDEALEFDERGGFDPEAYEDPLDHEALDHEALDHEALDHEALDHEALDHEALDHEDAGEVVEVASAFTTTLDIAVYRSMEIPVDASRRLRSATPTRPPRFSLTTTTRMRTLADLDAGTPVEATSPAPNQFIAVSRGRALIDTGHLRVDPGDASRFQVRIRGLLCHPARSAGSSELPVGSDRMPIAIFVHGQHTSIAFGLTAMGPIVPTLLGLGLGPARASLAHEVVSYKGYRYLQEHLARLGIVSLSVDTNAANSLGSLVQFRAELVLEALDHLRTLDATPGAPLHNRLDFSKVALVGHSRGGDAVAQAAALNQARPAATRCGLRAVVALAPTDFTGMLDVANRLRMTSSRTASFLCVYGSHDGDVSGDFHPSDDRSQAWSFTGTGFRHYDRATTQRAMVFVHGATHNRFNTVWVDPAAHSPGSFAHRMALAQADGLEDEATVDPRNAPSSAHPIPAGQRDARVLSAATHQVLAREYVGGWLSWWLLGIHAEQTRFTGARNNSLRVPIGLQWRFGRAVKTIDDFEDSNSATNRMGGAITGQPFVREQAIERSDLRHVPHHERVLAASHSATPGAYRSELPTSERDLSRFTALTFRIAKHFPNLSTPSTIGATSFPPQLTVTLTDGTTRASVDQSVIAPLNPRTVRPYFRDMGGVDLTKVHMQTWQIPLTSFAGVTLTAIEAIEITFAALPGEPIHLDTLALVAL